MPSSPLILYSAKVCPWAQRAVLALIEADATFEIVEIDLKNKPSWYNTRVNPASKVPVLQIGKDDAANVAKIPESHVVMELVADLFPEKDLLPKDPIERAHARYFIERYSQVVLAPFAPLVYKQDVESAPALLTGIKEIQSLLNRVPGPFVLGQKISIADLGVLPFVGRLFTLGKAGLIKGDVYETLQGEEYKVFREYAEGLMSRPSFKASFDEPYIIEKTKERITSAAL